MKTKQTVAISSPLANIMSWVCLGVLALLPFHAVLATWAGGVFNQPEAFKIWKEVLILFLVPGSIILWLRHKQIRRSLIHSTLMVAIAGYLVLTLLKAWYGYSAGYVNGQAMAYGLLANTRYLGFFVVVMVVAAASNILYRYWTKAVIGPAMVVTLFGLVQQLVLPPDFLRHFNYGPDTIPPFQTIDAKSDWIRAQSTLKGPNPLGAYLSIILTALTALFFKYRSKRWLLALATAATGLLLFFTYSRSAYIGVVVSLSAWLILGITSRRHLLRVGAGCLIFVLIVLGGIFVMRDNDFVQNAIFHTDENSTSNSSTNQVRGEALKNGLRNIRSAPNGRGVGSAGPASWHNNQPVRIAENYYIQIGEEVGLLGLLLFLIINGIVAVKLFGRRDDTLARILLASFIGITVINMLSHAWMDDTLSLMWWGLAGIALSPAIIKISHEKQTKSEKKAGSKKVASRS